jgi:hypothetical protein
MEKYGISRLLGVKLTRRVNSTEEADLIGTAQTRPSITENFGKRCNLQASPNYE